MKHRIVETENVSGFASLILLSQLGTEFKKSAPEGND